MLTAGRIGLKSLLGVAFLMTGCGSHASDQLRDDPSCMEDNAVVAVPLEPRSHIPQSQTPTYAANPPVSGPHWVVWARWQMYTVTVPRGNYVHNLEHGGVIFLYKPDAPRKLVDSLTRVYKAIPNDVGWNETGVVAPCSHPRAILTPDPSLDTPWAVTVSGPENPAPPLGNGYVIKGSCIRREQALVDFAVQRRNMAIEHFCDDGGYP